MGSAQESVSPCDFGGFCSFGKLVRRRSRCCGNVGTRVLCGFPSSEDNARTFESVSRFSALGASFPQHALDFVAYRTGCICEPVIRLQCMPFRKPRRMRTSPDFCSEPPFATPRSSLAAVLQVPSARCSSAQRRSHLSSPVWPVFLALLPTICRPRRSVPAWLAWSERVERKPSRLAEKTRNRPSPHAYVPAVRRRLHRLPTTRKSILNLDEFTSAAHSCDSWVSFS